RLLGDPRLSPVQRSSRAVEPRRHGAHRGGLALSRAYREDASAGRRLSINRKNRIVAMLATRRRCASRRHRGVAGASHDPAPAVRSLILPLVGETAPHHVDGLPSHTFAEWSHTTDSGFLKTRPVEVVVQVLSAHQPIAVGYSRLGAGAGDPAECISLHLEDVGA